MSEGPKRLDYQAADFETARLISGVFIPNSAMFTTATTTQHALLDAIRFL
jgi:hypothetical protein